MRGRQHDVGLDHSGEIPGAIQYKPKQPHSYLGSFSCAWTAQYTDACLGNERLVTMWACGSGGCGHIQGRVGNCELARVIRNNTGVGATYGVTSELEYWPSPSGTNMIVSKNWRTAPCQS